MDHCVLEKEVCIGIVTQIDLLTYITKHSRNKEEKQASNITTEKEKDETEEALRNEDR